MALSLIKVVFTLNLCESQIQLQTVAEEFIVSWMSSSLFDRHH